ncbi:universal stress protein [Spirosoma sp. KCTC 42546]|uniref:universal stress protein n=1 Tax=Spirosoma sp. KCTC 42546 TaxID=2520506 RepID=UPI00115797DA|nr:universal stress protein [Spirosoma sp. KCTC 42546]QDK81371.1 universal stress protein [Spirosoma sp. KCTC 42546]
MTTLLFPTDFSSNTTAALDWVRLFAHKTGATVTLLHVFQPMVADTTFPTLGDPGMGFIASQELEDISRQRLGKLADELQAEGLSVEVDWRIGFVDDSILDAARERSSDLIIMGRSDLSTFFDRLAGSAVTDVADSAQCPVLIVPTTPEGHAIRPAQVHTIAYAMQPETTQAQVSFQTDSLVEAFDAQLLILTEDKLEDAHADLIVMQLYPASGFLDSLFHPNHVAKLIEKSEVPVLVYHEKK